MKQAVRDAFVPFTSALEGVIPFMYLDVLGLVTTAIGNLIDPVETALDVPFTVKGTDLPASREAIRREWERVKAHPTAARQGHRVLALETSLRLTPAGIDFVVARRLALNVAILRQRFPEWDTWPADAQLATLSMAWACGPHFNFPALATALRSRDWKAAADHCRMRTEGNPGLVPRNYANKALYLAAARLDRDDDAVTWSVLTAIDAKLWPARPVVQRDTKPANDTDPVVIDGGTVHAAPILSYDRDPPDDAA